MSQHAKRREQFALPLYDDQPLPDDFAGQAASVGVSGGINSAGLLVHLLTEHPEERRPASLLLFAALLKEHAPDVNPFALAVMRWARTEATRQGIPVAIGILRASALAFFESERILPHPTVSPCTSALKLVPMGEWVESRGGADVDLVGYVRHERKRINRQRDRLGEAAGSKRYPIAHLSDADCFRLVDAHIGWHPEIYDRREDDGRPSYPNANCLPCKNQHGYQLKRVERDYPDHMRAARATAERMSADLGRPVYWGRESEYAGDPCAVCAFD